MSPLLRANFELSARTAAASPCPLLDSDNHRVGTRQVLDAGFSKSCFTHPLRAVFARVVKAAGSFNQHVETHQQSEGILLSFVINQSFKNNQGAAFRQRFVGFREQRAFFVKIPVMQDMPHSSGTSALGILSSKKLPGINFKRSLRPFAATYSS